MKRHSRIFEFYEECCGECKYGHNNNVCHGNSYACGECANGRYDAEQCLNPNEYCCACCDPVTDEEIEKGQCKYFVDEYIKYVEEDDEDEYEFDPRDADCESQG